MVEFPLEGDQAGIPFLTILKIIGLALIGTFVLDLLLGAIVDITNALEFQTAIDYAVSMKSFIEDDLFPILDLGLVLEFFGLYFVAFLRSFHTNISPVFVGIFLFVLPFAGYLAGILAYSALEISATSIGSIFLTKFELTKWLLENIEWLVPHMGQAILVGNYLYKQLIRE